LLETISAGGLCTGCGLSQSVTGGKAKMAFNQHGFLRPVLQPLTPADDTLVRAVCGPGADPCARDGQLPSVVGAAGGGAAGYALDPALRRRLVGRRHFRLLSYLLESGKVDYVLHIGASLSEPLINEIKLSHNRAEVLANAGSRYAPSAPLTGIDALLARPGRFAFVGKPCDVAALRKYAQHNPQVNEKVPYMLSFMCAGVPSMKGTRRF
jgi:coenzyme F420 hydrogenase subunit beta